MQCFVSTPHHLTSCCVLPIGIIPLTTIVHCGYCKYNNVQATILCTMSSPVVWLCSSIVMILAWFKHSKRSCFRTYISLTIGLFCSFLIAAYTLLIGLRAHLQINWFIFVHFTIKASRYLMFVRACLLRLTDNNST